MTVKREPALLELSTTKQWERWLEQHHASTDEGVWLRLYRKDTTPPRHTLTYPDAVLVALCFGWIDGQVRKHDDVSRVQRFTPRRPRSVWSKLNIERVSRLIEEGRDHLLLPGPIPFTGPARLLHGQRDDAVPWELSLETARALASESVEIILVKDGDHRLSRDEDLARLLRTVDEVSERLRQG